MFKFLKGVVGRSRSVPKDIPYNVGDPYASAWGSGSTTVAAPRNNYYSSAKISMLCVWAKASLPLSIALSQAQPRIPFLSIVFARLRAVSACLVPRELHDIGSEPPYVVDDPYLNLLSCSNSKSPWQGVCSHSPIVKLGLLDNLLLCNNLLSSYSKCNRLDEVGKLFDELPTRDVITWTTIISGYGRRRNYEEAFKFFRLMLAEDFPTLPNEFTYSSVICSASSLGALDIGEQTHALVVKRGFESNEVIGSTLLDVYSKCGKFEDAWKIFALMNYKDVMSWTAMISSFVEVGDLAKSMQLYICMIKSGIAPTEFTFAKLVTACGLMLHAHLIILGMKLNLALKTALVDMYLKCQGMIDSSKVFLQTPESDTML